MVRRLLVVSLVLAAALVPGLSPPATAQERHVLRIATLAPRGTVLVRALEEWDRRARDRSGGRVRIRVYPGGVAGDEALVVRKMRARQLDGAALTTTGLGLISREVLVLSAPGVIIDYEQMDRVRTQLADDFARSFASAGYRLLGWGDAGQTRLFSTRRIVRPSDLRAARPWVWTDNPIMVELMRTAGANGVALGVPEVYPGLQTGMIDTVVSSAIGALALQWFTRLRYVSRQPSGIVAGALVVREDAFSAIPEDVRAWMLEAATQADGPLRRAGRDADRDAWNVLSRRLTVVDYEPVRAEWEALGRRTRERLAGRLYSRELLRRVEAAAGQPSRR